MELPERKEDIIWTDHERKVSCVLEKMEEVIFVLVDNILITAVGNPIYIEVYQVDKVKVVENIEVIDEKA